LPVIQVPEASPVPKVVETRPAGGDETILVVEDDDAVRELTRTLLERFGYRTVEAASGPQALKQWGGRISEIDLMMTDMVMPGGVTGRELAERMRARRPSLKVLFMSGYSPEVAGKDTEFIHRNGSCFLQKPVPPRDLLQTVRRCLDSR
jgi:CheY-like chemotaxis protein